MAEQTTRQVYKVPNPGYAPNEYRKWVMSLGFEFTGPRTVTINPMTEIVELEGTLKTKPEGMVQLPDVVVEEEPAAE